MNKVPTSEDVIRQLLEERRRRMSPQGPLSRDPDSPASTSDSDYYESLLGLCIGVDPRVLQAYEIYVYGIESIGLERETVGASYVDRYRANGHRWDTVARQLGMPPTMLTELRRQAHAHVARRLMARIERDARRAG